MDNEAMRIWRSPKYRLGDPVISVFRPDDEDKSYVCKGFVIGQEYCPSNWNTKPEWGYIVAFYYLEDTPHLPLPYVGEEPESELFPDETSMSFDEVINAVYEKRKNNYDEKFSILEELRHYKAN